MGWKQWSTVAAVIGGGILLQIPGHDDMGAMDPGAMEQGDGLAELAAVEDTFRTVALDITGMT